MENSEFGESVDFYALTDIVALDANGSTSDTYKVRISGKWHFLKRPKQEFSNHPQYNAAFEKEFDIGYTLDHPNIVRYISKGRDKTGFYFLTEFVDGQTLKDFISNNSVYFKWKEHIQKFIEQLLSALSYLHQKQILHLDLKPENILITNIGHDVKIVDLGFAYSDCYQFLTTGRTNRYAAPEQINNGQIDQRTDIYGIGMVLLYVFTQTSDKKALNKIAQPYKSIVSKCLNDNMENRYFDVSSLAKDLDKSSKNKYVKYLAPLFLVLGIVLFFLLKPYFVKETEIPKIQAPAQTDSIETANQLIKESAQNKVEEKNAIEKKNDNSESKTTIIVQPPVKEVSMDSFCNQFRGKARTELSKIYAFKEPVTYSLEDQNKRFEHVREFFKQHVASTEDDELKDKLSHIFWYEYVIVAFPYIRDQFLAYLDKSKNEVIPDSITEAGDVYKLIDKEMADKFISFMKEYPTITNQEGIIKLNELFDEYDKEKERIYKQHKHLFESEDQFASKYFNKGSVYSIAYIWNWSDIFDTWSDTEYLTDDNPYIKIKLK